jgi:Fe-S-cluster-containing dehydrogenase component
MWDASKCNLCGDCLVNCRYANYDRDRAIAEITLLMEGKDAGNIEQVYYLHRL